MEQTLFDLDNPPRANTRRLVAELKENNQDFEFYPTTPEMLEIVCQHFKGGSILDIGCGTARLKQFLKEKGKEPEYFGIEKSEILLNQLPADVYILGTDFNNCTLIDKKVHTIFCNPPYSEFENWTNRIIREGNFYEAFLIIPERWKDNAAIQESLKAADVTALSLVSLDFLNAERQARAKINIVKLSKNKNEWSEKYIDPFNLWFETTFKTNTDKIKNEWEYDDEQREKIKNQLVSAPNKIEALVNLYNEEMNRLYGSFKAICALDAETLKDIGVDTLKVRESLKYKIEHTKILYWHIVFNYLDEITTRLTYDARDELFKKFDRLNQVDFNESNIRSVVIWVLKNASSLFDDQLVKLYKTFTQPDNIIKYKSNQRVFKRDEWYNNHFDRDSTVSHYCLSYRIICDRLYFRSSTWRGGYEIDRGKAQTIVDDLCAIAYNLGFVSASKDIPKSFGEKYYILMPDGEPLIEFKFYQNGNTHLKLDKEFAKALNVEVARLLGWIRDKSEIKDEFPDEMADGAEKYFGRSFTISLNNPNIKLLTSN